MNDFPGISKVAYEGPKSTNPLAFRYYNPEEVVAGKTMREQLKFALSYWHTLCGDGTDMFGRGTFVKDFGEHFSDVFSLQCRFRFKNYHSLP